MTISGQFFYAQVKHNPPPVLPGKSDPKPEQPKAKAVAAKAKPTVGTGEKSTATVGKNDKLPPSAKVSEKKATAGNAKPEVGSYSPTGTPEHALGGMLSGAKKKTSVAAPLDGKAGVQIKDPKKPSGPGKSGNAEVVNYALAKGNKYGIIHGTLDGKEAYGIPRKNLTTKNIPENIQILLRDHFKSQGFVRKDDDDTYLYFVKPNQAK